MWKVVSSVADRYCLQQLFEASSSAWKQSIVLKRNDMGILRMTVRSMVGTMFALANWSKFHSDTSVLHLVISKKHEADQIHLMLWQSHVLEKNQLTWKEYLLEQKYFTGSMPLLNPNHIFRTCGGPDVLTLTTIFKKCGVWTNSGELYCYTLKSHLEWAPLPCPIIPLVPTFLETFSSSCL